MNETNLFALMNIAEEQQKTIENQQKIILELQKTLKNNSEQQKQDFLNMLNTLRVNLEKVAGDNIKTSVKNAFDISIHQEQEAAKKSLNILNSTAKEATKELGEAYTDLNQSKDAKWWKEIGIAFLFGLVISGLTSYIIMFNHLDALNQSKIQYDNGHDWYLNKFLAYCKKYPKDGICKSSITQLSN